MATKQRLMLWCGTALLIAAVLLIICMSNEMFFAGTSEVEAARAEVAPVGSRPAISTTPDGGTRSTSKQAPRRVSYRFEDFKPLDWTVEELDGYLGEKAREFNSEDLADVMLSILPEPAGSVESPNRLKPGSLSLADLKYLVDKHLEPIERKMLYGDFWRAYGRNGYADEYKKLFIDPLPRGPQRSGQMGAYYLQKYSRGYAGTKALLSSAVLIDLKKQKQAQGGASDYMGIVEAVEGTLLRSLEKEEVTADQIVRDLEESNLDRAEQDLLSGVVRKREGEINRLRLERERR